MTKDERDYLDMVSDEKRKTAVEDAIMERKERERCESSAEAMEIARWGMRNTKVALKKAVARKIDALRAEARQSGYSHGWSDRAAIATEREYILTAQRDRLRDVMTIIASYTGKDEGACVAAGLVRTALKELEKAIAKDEGSK